MSASTGSCCRCYWGTEHLAYWCVCRSDWENPELHICCWFWNLSPPNGKRFTSSSLSRILWLCGVCHTFFALAIHSPCSCKVLSREGFMFNRCMHFTDFLIIWVCCCQQWPHTGHSLCHIRCDVHSGLRARINLSGFLSPYSHVERAAH